ncbi:hypothetical protein [Mameliella sp.]
MSKARRLKRAAFNWAHLKERDYPSWCQGVEHKDTVEFATDVAYEVIKQKRKENSEKVERFFQDSDEMSLRVLALQAAGCLERQGGDYDEQVQLAAIFIISAAETTY